MFALAQCLQDDMLNHKLCSTQTRSTMCVWSSLGTMHKEVRIIAFCVRVFVCGFMAFAWTFSSLLTHTLTVRKKNTQVMFQLITRIQTSPEAKLLIQRLVNIFLLRQGQRKKNTLTPRYDANFPEGFVTYTHTESVLIRINDIAVRSRSALTANRAYDFANDLHNERHAHGTACYTCCCVVHAHGHRHRKRSLPRVGWFQQTGILFECALRCRVFLLVVLFSRERRRRRPGRFWPWYSAYIVYAYENGVHVSECASNRIGNGWYCYIQMDYLLCVRIRTYVSVLLAIWICAATHAAWYRYDYNAVHVHTQSQYTVTATMNATNLPERYISLTITWSDNKMQFHGYRQFYCILINSKFKYNSVFFSCICANM